MSKKRTLSEIDVSTEESLPKRIRLTNEDNIYKSIATAVIAKLGYDVDSPDSLASALDNHEKVIDKVNNSNLSCQYTCTIYSKGNIMHIKEEFLSLNDAESYLLRRFIVALNTRLTRDMILEDITPMYNSYRIGKLYATITKVPKL